MVIMTNDYEALRRALDSSKTSGLGQLVSVSLTVEPRMLENALEALALADFPINPQLTHQRLTLIEFPAYRGQLPQLQNLLKDLEVQLTARNMLDEIRMPVR